MDLQVVNNSITLVRRIMDSRSVTQRCIETTPEKPPCPDSPILSPFPRATPESTGIPSRLLAEYFRALAADESLDMHSVTILRGGKIIAEASFGAYDRLAWHISYSECKSIVGLAIGMLIDEGRLSLDDKLVKIFGDKVPMLSMLTMREVTVRHLLTMTTGVLFNEAGSVTETDWLRSYFESSLWGELGAKFNYNSMNTYMLSSIVKQVSGQSLMEYLRPRLWEPLEIDRVFWETCPKGTEKGGWGLYIRQEDMAKVGRLILQKGRWNGKQLISREWIDAATTTQVKVPPGSGDYDYGYQIWTGRDRHSFLFSGMFDQNVLGFFDSDILVVSNSGNLGLFQTSNFFPITHKYLGGNFGAPLSEDASGAAELAAAVAEIGPRPAPAAGKSLFRRRPAEPPWRFLVGKSFLVNSDNAPHIGLLPLMIQALQNNYTEGLVSLAFSEKNGKLIFTVGEIGESYALPVGFDAPEYADLCFHGEPQRVGVTGRLATNEDDLPVLILRVSFLETAHTRHIRLYFNKNGTKLTGRWYENPGVEFLQTGLDSALSEVKFHPALAEVAGKAAPDYITFRLKSAFEPEITAVSKNV